MKSLDLFCASPASTAICSSMDQYSMVRHGMRRHIDRHTQRLGDRLKSSRDSAPCSSPQLPFDPSRLYRQKGRKSSATEKEFRRKSSAEVTDISSSSHSSSRYLLSDDKPLLDFASDAEHISSALVPYSPVKDKKQLKARELPVFRSSSTRLCDDSSVYKSSSVTSPSLMWSGDTLTQSKSLNGSHVRNSSSTRARPSDNHHYQVVELRVSIHCKGCEGKVRKHLSRMEGVTSFSIDFASKKVTVIGDVTPLGVLASISKVKNAQFWPSPTASSSSSSSSMSGRG